MFQEFRKRRSRGDILEVPDWANFSYLFIAAGFSIWAVYLTADHLPGYVKPLNLLMALIFAFIGLGLFLTEWFTKSPLKRIFPTLFFFVGLCISLLLIPVQWIIGPAGLLFLAYQRYRFRLISRKKCPPSAP